jgi:hypothetical protein
MESVMAMLQSMTTEEQILYWLSLDLQVRRWLRGCSKNLYKVSTPTPHIRTLTHYPVIHTILIRGAC